MLLFIRAGFRIWFKDKRRRIFFSNLQKFPFSFQLSSETSNPYAVRWRIKNYLGSPLWEIDAHQ